MNDTETGVDLAAMLHTVAEEQGWEVVYTANVDAYTEKYDFSRRQIVIQHDWTTIAIPKEEEWSEYKEMSKRVSPTPHEAKSLQS